MTLIRNIQALLLVVLLGSPMFVQAGQGEPVHLHTALLNGGNFDIKEHRGKVVVVGFWATWCAVCQAEFPGWQRFYDDYKDRDIEMIAVSIDRSRDNLEKFIKNTSYTVPIGWRPEVREIGGFQKFRGTPTVFFIDRDGTVERRRTGRVSESYIRRTVDSLLEP